MTRQLAIDVNEADEAEQRRLEDIPVRVHAVAVPAGARAAADGEDMPNGLRVASAWREGGRFENALRRG